MVESASGDSVDNLSKANLRQVCTALEQKTETLPEGDAKRFTWQRNGDLRYSFLHWVDRPQLAGARSATARRRPIRRPARSSRPSAYIYGAALNTYAQTAADAVQLLNNPISIDDLLSGKTIADVLAENAATRKSTQAQPLTPEAKAMAATMLGRGGPPRPQRLVPIAPGASRRQDRAHQGDRGREAADDRRHPQCRQLPNDAGRRHPDCTPDQFGQARPANWLTPEGARQRARARSRTLATNGCVYMGEFADDSIIGTAMELAGLPPDEIFKRLRAAIFRGLSEHEMGHTMGLRHNFAGSTDALNYHDDYWKIRTGRRPRRPGTRTRSASSSTRRSWTTARGSTATSTAWASTTTRRSASATGSSST